MDRFQTRRDKLRRLLAKEQLDGILVTSFANVTWLTGFTGDDSHLVLGLREEVLVTDSRYTTQLEEECPRLRLAVRPTGTTIAEADTKAIGSLRLARLGVEGHSLTVATHEKLVKDVPKVAFTTTAGLVEQLRAIKDPEEIEEIRQAIWYAERAFGVMKASLAGFATEKDAADHLENQMRVFGATRASFPPIIAAGPRAALPHARATDRPLDEDDFVLVDWGARGRLYVSDLTRMIVTGRISPKLERVYGVVLQAQQRAIAAIRPGATCQDVDKIARATIADAGFGKHFGHSLGHGIGLAVHEAPSLAPKKDEPLKAGMVVTVEPGIYLPGWGGVRIEDDVLVTRGGHEVLSSVPKELPDAVAL
jgi:Xaa-Pro aminopeptidase